MRSRRLSAATLAFAAATLLTLAPAAWSHGHGTGAGKPGPLKLDRSESSALGAGHAREHARARVLERLARARWERMTPAQRRQRVSTAELASQSFTRSLEAQTSRSDVGFWDQQLYPLQDEAAIHASMMPTGELLIFGRQALNERRVPITNRGSASIFDPRTGQARPAPPPPIPENPSPIPGEPPMPAAIYCAGQALLSDGRVLIVGGNLSEPDPDPSHGRPNYAGLRYTFLFDPWKEKAGQPAWEIGPRMSNGRWYPSVVKLSSGDTLIMSGYDETGRPNPTNPRMDLFRPGIDDRPGVTALVPFPGGFRGPGSDVAPGARHGQSLYPRMFTLPDGNVVLASPGGEDSAILDTKKAIDRNSPKGSAWRQLSPPSDAHFGGAAVLEPQMDVFGGSWRVLVAGGAPEFPYDQLHLGTDVVERLNAGPGTQGWSSQPPLGQPRHFPNNVLLPDGGMVLVGGGSGNDPNSVGNFYLENPAPPQLRQVELRQPDGTWRLGAAQQEWRTYHSTASLLPDGRVFSGGDDYHEGPDPLTPLPASERRDSAEIYWPPYLFNGDDCAPRPAIRDVKATSTVTLPWPGPEPRSCVSPPAVPPAPPAVAAPTLTYAKTFGIFSEHAQNGMQAVLVAPSATTHSFDMNQRVVPLRIASVVEAGGLNAVAPANSAIAPPGYYMLFVIDADGTPSIARWVRLPPPPRAALTPAPKPSPAPLKPPQPITKLTAKLAVRHARIRRGSRRLEVLARISSKASGKVKMKLVAGGRRTSFEAKIDAARRRIRVLRKIPKSQARLGTGIVTISYAGDKDTRSQSVRLRAAPHAARLAMKRPTLTSGGRIRARGTIAKRARGGVRVQLQFDYAGLTRTEELRARISKGAWKLDEQLSKAVRAQISKRSGTLHSYTLFTGYKRAGMRGEMRSFEVLGDP